MLLSLHVNFAPHCSHISRAPFSNYVSDFAVTGLVLPILHLYHSQHQRYKPWQMHKARRRQGNHSSSVSTIKTCWQKTLGGEAFTTFSGSQTASSSTTMIISKYCFHYQKAHHSIHQLQSSTEQLLTPSALGEIYKFKSAGPLYE